MRRFVVWSGGYDSTLILYNEIQKKIKKESDCDLKTISFDVSFIGPAKQKAEEYHRNKFIEKFQSFAGVSIFESEILTIDFKLLELNVNVGLFQQPFWISMLPFILKSDDVVLFGFHSGDDYWHYKTNCEQAFKSLCKVLGKENVTIEYPLEFESKEDIIKSVVKADIDKFCTTCEFPIFENDKWKFCGRCKPCELLNKNKFIIDNFYKDDEAKMVEEKKE